MLKFSVVTLFSKMLTSNFEEGLVGQALKKNLFSLETLNPREFANDIHKTVDDRPFGGGDGMVMLAESLAKSIDQIKEKNPDTFVVYLSAQGKPWSAEMAEHLSTRDHVTLICGRYGGIDQRFINEYVDQEISIGDYVLSGGELAAAVIIDSTVRFVDGVLGNKASSQMDSFTRDGLEAPLFTRPETWRDQKVPEVLLSGNHKNINEWREMVGDLTTWFKRRDLTTHWSKEKITQLKNEWSKLTAQDKEICGLPGKRDFDE